MGWGSISTLVAEFLSGSMMGAGGAVKIDKLPTAGTRRQSVEYVTNSTLGNGLRKICRVPARGTTNAKIINLFHGNKMKTS